MSEPAAATNEKLVHVSVGQVLRKLWPSLSPYRLQFLVGTLLILCTTAIEILLPILIGHTVDLATPQGDPQLLTRFCLLYLGLIFVKATFEAIQAYVIQLGGQNVTHRLRNQVFSKVASLPVPYFDRNPTGRLLTRVVNDIKALSELFTASISVLALDCLIIAGTVGAMLWLHWKLALLTLATFPLVLLTIRFFGVRLAIAYRKVRLKLAEMNAFLGENVGAIATIQRLGAETSRMERFSGIVEDHRVAQMESLRVFAVVQPIANLLNGIAMSVLLVAGGYWVIQGKISLGVVVAFLGYLRNLYQPVRDLVEKYNTFLSSMMSAERIVDILDEREEEGKVSPLSFPPGPVDVKFDRVVFKYPTREGFAIDNVSFHVPAKTSLAIVGATGSGKSTLVRLLLRFYDPQSGEIRLNDESIQAWPRAELRRHIGVVHQEIYLFKGTLRNNLTLGRTDLSDAFLIERCERAQLWPLIQNRGGLDMEVMEGGTNFSLGERQLISMARVLIMDCPLLILDEATSSIDRAIERRLLVGLHETIQSRTSIVIAHRLSTIQECHRILVMEEGRLVESGTFDELLVRRGKFARFYQIYSRLHESPLVV